MYVNINNQILDSINVVETTPDDAVNATLQCVDQGLEGVVIAFQDEYSLVDVKMAFKRQDIVDGKALAYIRVRKNGYSTTVETAEPVDESLAEQVVTTAICKLFTAEEAISLAMKHGDDEATAVAEYNEKLEMVARSDQWDNVVITVH